MTGHNLSRRWMAMFALLLTMLLAVEATAQEDESNRIALLDIPGGGTELLVKALEDVDGSVEVKSQKWFLSQVKSRGIKAKKLLRRPKDLRWVMQGAKLKLIVYLKPGEEDVYNVTFVGEDGENAKDFEVDKTSDGLSENGAKQVADEFRKHMGLAGGAVVATVDDLPEEDPLDQGLDATKLKDAAKQEEDDVADRLSQDWLFFRLQGRFLKRDLNITGANGAVLNYAASFYPGFEAEFEVYPGAPINQDYADLGLFANYLMGFSTVTAAGAEEGTTESLPVTQMEIEGGTKYRLVSPLGQASSTTMVQAEIKLSARYSSFNVDPNRSLPKTSMIEVIVGARVLYPVFFEGFAVTGNFDVTPFGMWGDSKELFGETAYTYGFSASLGGVYEVSDAIGILFGYKFRILRTAFEGNGTLDFSDSDAFELVQGANVGLVYQY